MVIPKDFVYLEVSLKGSDCLDGVHPQFDSAVTDKLSCLSVRLDVFGLWDHDTAGINLHLYQPVCG